MTQKLLALTLLLLIKGYATTGNSTPTAGNNNAERSKPQQTELATQSIT